MCLVETPYYHRCGHYGHQVTVPHGRCIRADRNPKSTYGCWDTEDMGIKSIDSACLACQRRASDPELLPSKSTLFHGDVPRNSAGTGRGGPIDVARFNSLVRLHQRTFERRESIASSTISDSESTLSIEQLHARNNSVASTISTLSAPSASSVTGTMTVQTFHNATQTFQRRTPQALVHTDCGDDCKSDDLGPIMRKDDNRGGP